MLGQKVPVTIFYEEAERSICSLNTSPKRMTDLVKILGIFKAGKFCIPDVVRCVNSKITVASCSIQKAFTCFTKRQKV
jgi:hypothetical protein